MTAFAQHLTLVALLWGYIASWANEVIKQDGWPKWVNTLVADGVVAVTALVVALQQQQKFTLTLFWAVFVPAILAALANVHGFLLPTGIGPRIQTLTSLPPSPS